MTSNVVFGDRYDKRAFSQIKGKAQKLQALENRGLEKLKTYSPLLQDLYSILYKADPILKQKEQVQASERINRMLVEKVMDTKQYPELREYTYLSEFASSMAVLELGQVVLELIPERVKKQLNDIKEQEDNELQDLVNQAQTATSEAQDAQDEADELAAQGLEAQAEQAQALADEAAQAAKAAAMTFEQAQEKLEQQAQALEEELEQKMGEKMRQALRKACQRRPRPSSRNFRDA